MRLASGLATVTAFLSRRFRFLVLEVKRCPAPDLRLFSFPVAVLLNLLAADLLVLALGTMNTPT
jgi:hypothetical protein